MSNLKLKNLEKALKKGEISAQEQRKIRDLLKSDDKSEDLNWMYKKSKPEDEEYLLGKRIDKQYKTEEQEQLEQAKAEKDASYGAIFEDDNIVVRAKVDMNVKMREDPLYAIRKREEEARRKLLNNPVKMKLLQKVVEERQKKNKKHKKKKKKHTTDDDDDEELLNKYLSLIGTSKSSDRISNNSEKHSKRKHKKKNKHRTYSDSDSSENRNCQSQLHVQDDIEKGKRSDYRHRIDGSQDREKCHQSQARKFDRRSIRKRELSPEIELEERVKHNYNGFNNKGQQRSRKDGKKRKQYQSDSSDSPGTSPNMKLKSKNGKTDTFYSSRKRSGENEKYKFRKTKELCDTPSPSRPKRRHDTPSPRRSKKRHNTPSPSRSKRRHDTPSPSRSKRRCDTPSPSRRKRRHDTPSPSRSKRRQDVPSPSKSKSHHDTPNPSRLKKTHNSPSPRSRNKYSTLSPSRSKRHHDTTSPHRDGRKPDYQRKRSPNKGDVKLNISSSSDSSSSDSSSSDEEATSNPTKQYGLIGGKKRSPGRHINVPVIKSTKKPEQLPIKKQEPKRKLNAKEKEARLREMMDNAKWRDDQRAENVKRYREQDKREEEELVSRTHSQADFVNPLMASHASESSVADRIKRNMYNVQRSKAGSEQTWRK